MENRNPTRMGAPKHRSKTALQSEHLHGLSRHKERQPGKSARNTFERGQMPGTARTGGRGATTWTTRAGGNPSRLQPLSEEESDASDEIQVFKPPDPKKSKKEIPKKSPAAEEKPGPSRNVMKQKTTKSGKAAKGSTRGQATEDRVQARGADDRDPAVEPTVEADEVGSTAKAGSKVGSKAGTTAKASRGAGPQPASLAQIFGGTPSTVPRSGQRAPENPRPELLTREDYKFLQNAYEGVQEQNNALLKLLSNLSESNQKLLEEKEMSQLETKRLREVRPSSSHRRLPVLNII